MCRSRGQTTTTAMYSISKCKLL